MPDIANLVLAIDSTAAAKASADLDGLAAAGARTESATAALGAGFRGVGVEASAMAGAAQLAGRAAVTQAAGFGTATQAARLNTMALRETLVVAREISRGNFTRLPGSLTLLAQGIGSQGGIGAYGAAISQMLGLTRKVQDAELAEAAADKAASAAAIEGATQRARSAVLAADAEYALAEAAQRTATKGEQAKEAAARMTAARAAVTATTREAQIAENALASAMADFNVAQANSVAATRTLIGGSAVGLTGLAIVAGIAYGAFKEFQGQVRDSGVLDRYAQKLDLTDAQIKKAGGSVTYLGHNIKEVHGLTVGFGDVAHGVFQELARELGNAGPWEAFANNAGSAFNYILSGWSRVSAALSAGLDTATDQIVYMAKHPMGGLEGFDADSAYAKHRAEEQKKNEDAFGHIAKFAIQNKENTLKDLSDGNNPRAPKKEKKGPGDHGLAEALAKLDAEIKGQYALAEAYGVSYAAAQRAEAQQKAAEDALSHKGGYDQFYAKELQESVATDVAAQAKANAGTRESVTLRSQLNDQVASGTLSLSEYNERLKIQTTLNKLNGDLENADAAHKGEVNTQIQQTIDLYNEELLQVARLDALKSNAANDNEIARLKLEASLMGKSNSKRAVAIAQLEAMQHLREIDPNGLLSKGQRDSVVTGYVQKAQAGVVDPFHQWAKDIPSSTKAINDNLQSIAFKGFDGLATGIADVVTGTKSLGAAFKDISKQIVSEITQMIVKMLIFRALSSAFGLKQAPSSGALQLTQVMSQPIPHLAGGGLLSVGGNGGTDSNLLSINGQPRAMVDQTETLAVIPRGAAANNNRAGPIEVHVLVDTSENLDAKIDAKVVSGAQQAVAVSVAHTNKSLAQYSRAKLNGGG